MCTLRGVRGLPMRRSWGTWGVHGSSTHGLAVHRVSVCCQWVTKGTSVSYPWVAHGLPEGCA